MATNANNDNSKYGLRPEPVEAKERVHREEKEMKGADAEAQAAARDIEERTEEEREAAANRRQERPQERRQDNIETSDAPQENHKTLHEELHPQNGPVDPAGAKPLEVSTCGLPLPSRARTFSTAVPARVGVQSACQTDHVIGLP